MKKNAFTLIELIATLVILGVISSIAIVSYNKYIIKVTSDSYTDAEKTMKAAAESFLTYCNSSSLHLPAECVIIPSAEESVEITLETLVNNGFMSAVNDQNNNNYCTGKVTVVNENRIGTSSVNYNLNYKVCLRCSRYQSRDCE